MIKKSVSKWLSLATMTILGQPASYQRQPGMTQSRRLISLFAGLILPLFLTSAHALSTEAQALSHALDRFLFEQADSSHLRKIKLTAIKQFYAERAYQPVWSQANSPTAQFDTALTLIAAAKKEGLNSDDYDLKRLTQLAVENEADQRYELEFLTTRSLLLLADDLSRGRFEATDIDPNWYIRQPEFDPVSFLLQAIDYQDLQQAFARLQPQIPSYHQLKQALAKFQDLVAREVTWTPIPDIPLLQPGDSHPVIPLVRARMTEAYETHGKPGYALTSYEQGKQGTQNNLYDIQLETAIKTFQLQHGLNADGIIGPNTLNALNKTPTDKLQQVRINMERLRWLPRDLGDRYLLVNIAGFQLAAIENDRNILDMRIVVGRYYRSTPSFHSHISHIIINPYWNIPISIARKDLLPKQQKNPGFFSEQNIKVYPDYSFSSTPIDPDTVDWDAFDGTFPYALRQDPGANNALGLIKFMLSNPFSIYLHDTPSKELFHKEIRTFSSGCIRLEKPLALAEFVLNEQISQEQLNTQIDSGETVTINLSTPLSTYIVYLTTWVDSQNNIHYSPDTYERNKRALHLMRW